MYKLGIAPQIQDLYGVAKFTEEEITTMASELQKYGLNLPAFSKIGGILANEMPIDEAALHAAILAINDAVEKKDLEVLLNDLKLHDAHLTNIVDDYIKFYHELMHEAKINKSNIAQNKVIYIRLNLFNNSLFVFTLYYILPRQMKPITFWMFMMSC